MLADISPARGCGGRLSVQPLKEFGDLFDFLKLQNRVREQGFVHDRAYRKMIADTHLCFVYLSGDQLPREDLALSKLIGCKHQSFCLD